MTTPDQLHKLAQQSTYLTERSSASVLEDGFDREKLARELATSIQLEATRQKIDDTKKRAITTARDYNEFKNMVLMADQTRVTTKEMKNFGNDAMKAGQHRGREESNNQQVFSRINGAGKPESRGRASRSAKRREKKRAAQKKANDKNGILESKGPQPPTSHNDFARDWARFGKTDEARLKYLLMFGSRKTITKVFKPSLDFMMLGTLLNLFAHAMATKPAASEAGDENSDAQATKNASKIADFLIAFSGLSSFAGTLHLLGDADCRVGATLASQLAVQVPAESEKLAAIAKKFQAEIKPKVVKESEGASSLENQPDDDVGDDSDSEDGGDGDTDSDDDSSSSEESSSN